MATKIKTQSTLTRLTQQKTALELQTMSKEALAWLSKKVAIIKNKTRIQTAIGREEWRHKNKFYHGGMYFFAYDAKYKDILPYFDRFPLVLMLERYDDGFLGLNLHYLPLKYRIAFLEKLMSHATAQYNNMGEVYRIKITYEILKAATQFKEFQPCLKRYLWSHIQSKVILKVEPEEWDVAAFLPIQRFHNAPSQTVWKDSRKMAGLK